MSLYNLNILKYTIIDIYIYIFSDKQQFPLAIVRDDS